MIGKETDATFAPTNVGIRRDKVEFLPSYRGYICIAGPSNADYAKLNISFLHFSPPAVAKSRSPLTRPAHVQTPVCLQTTTWVSYSIYARDMSINYS